MPREAERLKVRAATSSVPEAFTSILPPEEIVEAPLIAATVLDSIKSVTTEAFKEALNEALKPAATPATCASFAANTSI